MTTDVRLDADRSRYEIWVDDQVTGYAEYRSMDGTRVFTHTIVDPEVKGRGLGGILVKGALDDVRRSGGSIVALCPFVDNYIREHPEYADLVDTELDRKLRSRSV